MSRNFFKFSYIPQEEQPKYQNPSQAAAASRGRVVVGMTPRDMKQATAGPRQPIAGAVIDIYLVT